MFHWDRKHPGGTPSGRLCSGWGRSSQHHKSGKQSERSLSCRCQQGRAKGQRHQKVYRYPEVQQTGSEHQNHQCSNSQDRKGQWAMGCSNRRNSSQGRKASNRPDHAHPCSCCKCRPRRRSGRERRQGSSHHEGKGRRWGLQEEQRCMSGHDSRTQDHTPQSGRRDQDRHNNGQEDKQRSPHQFGGQSSCHRCQEGRARECSHPQYNSNRACKEWE